MSCFDSMMYIRTGGECFAGISAITSYSVFDARNHRKVYGSHGEESDNCVPGGAMGGDVGSLGAVAWAELGTLSTVASDYSDAGRPHPPHKPWLGKNDEASGAQATPRHLT